MNEYGEQYREMPITIWGITYRVTIKTDDGWCTYELDEINVDDPDRDITNALDCQIVDEIDYQTALHLNEFITEGHRRVV